MNAVATPTSVFLAALGEEADRLRPEVLDYVTGPSTPGTVGVGAGTFEVAGSRFGRWNLLARPVVGPGLLVTTRERNVPFDVVNIPSVDGIGPALEAERVFRFASGDQGFADVLYPGRRPGELRNLLGERRRVELRLACAVTAAGNLSLRSTRAWLRLGRFRIRLPAVLGVRAELEEGYDASRARHTVRASVRNPILGTVLEYRGTFTYRYVPA